MFQLNDEETMPAFTFEKISPPVRGTPVPSSAPVVRQHSKGIIVQIVERFVELRVKRTMQRKNGVIVRANQKPPA